MSKKTVKYIAGGSLTGIANGLFGGGGGMIVVPALERAGNINPLSAHATAIAVILPASAISAFVYLFLGLVPLKTFLPVALGVVLGGFLGAKFLPRLPVRAVAIAFAAFMLVAGVRMVI